MDRDAFRGAYLEATPYALRGHGKPGALPKHPGEEAHGVLDQLRDRATQAVRAPDANANANVQAEVQMQLEREREVMQQRDQVDRPVPCLPVFSGRGGRALDHYTHLPDRPPQDNAARADAHRLGVVLSPLITGDLAGQYGRVYLRNKGRTQSITLLTWAEALALPAREQQDRIVRVHADGATLPADAHWLDVLGHLLCGFTLDLADQLKLIGGVASAGPERAGALRRLLDCFHRSRLIDLPEGQILRHFSQQRDGLDILEMLGEFKKTHLSTTEGMLRYLFRSEPVVEFLSGRSKSARPERDRLRLKILESLRPLQARLNQAFDGAEEKVRMERPPKVLRGPDLWRRNILRRIGSDHPVGVADVAGGSLHRTWTRTAAEMGEGHKIGALSRPREPEEPPAKRRRRGDAPAAAAVVERPSPGMTSIILEFGASLATTGQKQAILAEVVQRGFSTIVLVGEKRQTLGDILKIYNYKEDRGGEDLFRDQPWYEGEYSVFTVTPRELFSCARCHLRTSRASRPAHGGPGRH